MPPKAENCWDCDCDMNTLPDELRNEFCWVKCPKCWLGTNENLANREYDTEFLAMCERLGVHVDSRTKD